MKPYCPCGHPFKDHNLDGFPWTGDYCEKCRRYCMGDDVIEAGGLYFRRERGAIIVMQRIDFDGKEVFSQLARIPLSDWSRVLMGIPSAEQQSIWRRAIETAASAPTPTSQGEN